MRILFLLILLLPFQAISQDLPRRAFMGIVLSRVSEDDKVRLGHDSNEGILVTRVYPQSSAAAAGLQVDDIILDMNGSQIEGVRNFLASLKKYETGDKIKLDVFREKKNMEIDLVLTGFPLEENPAFETIYTSIINGQNHQRVLITKPFGDGPFPVILNIQGVGCVSMDFPLEVMKNTSYTVIDSLTRNGFATIRVERSGMGDSKGQPCSEIDFQTDVGGFRSILKDLHKYPYLNREKVYLMGFSMGGVIAPILANEFSVKGIIAYGTASINWLEYELENTRRQHFLNRERYDSVSYIMRLEEQRLHEFYVEKKTPDEIIESHPEEKKWFSERWSMYPQHYTYFQQVGDVNMLDLWAKCNTHVLAIHGSSDYVSSATDHELIARVVNSIQTGSGTYVELPNSDHWFNYAETYMESKKAVRDSGSRKNLDFIQVVLDWLTKLS